jgi:tetratricopeptide (TPR) repeat protein
LSRQVLKQAYYRLRSSDLPAKTNLDQRQHEILLEATHSYRTLGVAYWFREELAAFVYSGVYNANLAQQLGVSSELLEAFANLTATLGSVPGQPFANSYMRQALAISQESNDFSARAWLGLTVGIYMLEIGAWVEGLRLSEQGCAFCEQIGHRRLWEENRSVNAVLLCRWGKFRDSIGRFQEVYASANRRDDPQPQVWALSGLVENALWTGAEHHESKGHLQEALQYLNAKNVSLNDHIRTHGLLALLHVRLGNLELARQEADLVLDLMKQSNFLIPYSYDGYVAPVDVYLALWEKEDDRSGDGGQELSRFARKGLKTARSLGRTYPVFQPRALYYQGRYDWLSGKQNKAQKAWRKSIDLARELDMPHEEGLAEYEYDRHLTPDDPEREVHLKDALGLFINTGADYYIGLVQEELNRPV